MMKSRVLFSFLFLTFFQGVMAYDLSPGHPFPNLTLPSIKDGNPTPVDSLFGEKLMLHLFASW